MRSRKLKLIYERSFGVFFEHVLIAPNASDDSFDRIFCVYYVNRCVMYYMYLF